MSTRSNHWDNLNFILSIVSIYNWSETAELRAMIGLRTLGTLTNELLRQDALPKTEMLQSVRKDNVSKHLVSCES